MVGISERVKHKGRTGTVRSTYRGSFAVFGVDGEGNGAVVDEGYFHVRSEFAGGHWLAQILFQGFEE